MANELSVLGSITLPGKGRSARYLRVFARDILGPAHPRLDDIGLCLTEKFTNATLHTASGQGGWVTVRVRGVHGLVRTEVTDDGADGRRPRSRPPEPDAFCERGRGLLLLSALADRWGFDEAGARTVVWAEFLAPAHRSPAHRRDLGGG
ncbi:MULTISPECIES: ATP-binding protein [Thermomonosporaceae]|uniref:ATP-binding protein n=1 Tax=Thermomonosporaceae TaxID=2012 RepID=UPI00255ACAE2|nr:MULTISPECIES: ATP-binding protein [Thermomonosporaceae]MDL4776560.1 ATP-binding protein [Actinomadura xylanilytica]